MRSTPRRFGKTFSIAIFAACMALSFGCEIVVFVSPALSNTPSRVHTSSVLTIVCMLAVPGPSRVSQAARAHGTLPTHPSPSLAMADMRVCSQVEFIRLLDCDSSIVEFNQEQCRVTAYNGKSSLIRSFP